MALIFASLVLDALTELGIGSRASITLSRMAKRRDGVRSVGVSMVKGRDKMVSRALREGINIEGSGRRINSDFIEVLERMAGVSCSPWLSQPCAVTVSSNIGILDSPIQSSPQPECRLEVVCIANSVIALKERTLDMYPRGRLLHPRHHLLQRHAQMPNGNGNARRCLTHGG